MFNPQRFLTAIMQESARANTLELDKLVINTTVLKRQVEDIEAAARDGAFINGLYLEGARFDLGGGILEPSRPKEMYFQMPVIQCKAILAAKAGAAYVSPFVGRLDDNSIAGLEVVRSISDLYRIHGIETKVLAASIREVHRAVRSWYNGAEIVTMPPSVFEKMYNHVLTDKGLDIFDKDWEAVQNARS